jgi:hypothetical protein
MPLTVITGASSGLGETFARRLAASGSDLLLAARRGDRLELLKRELEAAHRVAVEPFVCDLADEGEVERLAKRLESEERIDLLINNAGFGTKGRFWETDWPRQLAMHRVHVFATLRLTRAALPAMVERGEGGVINVSSVAGFFRSAGNVSYCATKGWMNDFTEGLRLELDAAGSRVAVQALCPGFTYTEFHDTMGVDRSVVARWLWMPADFVVEESLRGLEARKVFVIPSWKYRLAAAFSELLPMGWRLALERASPHKKDRV